MDISNWPMEKIMQLPDSAFGTRFSIIMSASVIGPVTTVFTLSIALPDRCILHELSIGSTVQSSGLSSVLTDCSLSLGGSLPASVTEFDLLEPLLTGIEEKLFGSKIMRPPLHLTRLHLPVLAQGRKVVLRVHVIPPFVSQLSVGLVFSSIPNEIPDFYAGFPEEKFDEMIRLLRIGVKIR